VYFENLNPTFAPIRRTSKTGQVTTAGCRIGGMMLASRSALLCFALLSIVYVACSE
jgi:poly(3-hydroxyalkanoate) synthetase